MTDEDRSGFDIVINRSVYAQEADDTVVKRVYGGRGAMTVGQLVEKGAMNVALILYHLSEHGDFNWSGIMPVLSGGDDHCSPRRGVACLRQGGLYGPSRRQPCVVWDMGHVFHGERAMFYSSIYKVRAESIVQSYPEPIYSLDAVLEIPELEVP